MAMQALLIAAADDPCWDWLRQCLGEGVVLLPADADRPAGCVAEIAEIPDVALVFVRFDRDNAGPSSAIVEAVTVAHGALPVVAVGREEDAETVLSAMRAGAEDFFAMGRDDERLLSLLDRVFDRRRKQAPATAAQRSRGQVVSLFSAPQSPMLAFVGGHMAFVLKAAAPEARVLLFDLSLPGGTAPIIFDGAQNYTALDIFRDIDRCDDTLVESAFGRLPNGVHLLALPEHFNAETLRDRTVDMARLIAILRELFDYVVICGDRGLGMGALGPLVAQSDHALLLSDATVLCSRQNKAMLYDLRQHDDSHRPPRLLVADDPAETGMTAERLAELLDIPLAGRLSGRPGVRTRAMNAGESMLESAPADGFSRDVVRFTEQLLGIESAAPRRRRGLARMLSRGRTS